MGKVNELLPLGSIVRMREGEKKIMIVGQKQMNPDEGDSEYDYLGFLYPEGHLGENFQYLFNHEDIEEVYFEGYRDAERESFIQKLSKFYGEE